MVSSGDLLCYRAANAAIDMPAAGLGASRLLVHYPLTHMQNAAGVGAPGVCIPAGRSLVVYNRQAVGTIIENIITQGGGISVKDHLGQCRTCTKRRVLQFRYIGRNCHFRQCSTAAEGIGTDGCNILANDHIRQSCAVIKCPGADGGHTVRNHDLLDFFPVSIPGRIRRGGIVFHGTGAGNSQSAVVETPLDVGDRPYYRHRKSGGLFFISHRQGLLAQYSIVKAGDHFCGHVHSLSSTITVSQRDHTAAYVQLVLILDIAGLSRRSSNCDALQGNQRRRRLYYRHREGGGLFFICHRQGLFTQHSIVKAGDHFCSHIHSLGSRVTVGQGDHAAGHIQGLFILDIAGLSRHSSNRDTLQGVLSLTPFFQGKDRLILALNRRQDLRFLLVFLRNRFLLRCYFLFRNAFLSDLCFRFLCMDVDCRHREVADKQHQGQYKRKYSLHGKDPSFR